MSKYDQLLAKAQSTQSDAEALACFRKAMKYHSSETSPAKIQLFNRVGTKQQWENYISSEDRALRTARNHAVYYQMKYQSAEKYARENTRKMKSKAMLLMFMYGFGVAAAIYTTIFLLI